MLNAFTYAAPFRPTFIDYRPTFIDYRLPAATDLIDAFFAEHDDADSLATSPVVDNRRFRGHRKTTRDGVSVEFRRFGGRPGGDVGNRKRRNNTRYDDWKDNIYRLRMEERAVQQQIEEGIADYFDGWRAYDDGKSRNKRDNRRHRNRGNNMHNARSDRKNSTSPRPDVLTVPPNDHDTNVVFNSTPARRVVRTGNARPRLSNATLREMLGLPPRETAAA